MIKRHQTDSWHSFMSSRHLSSDVRTTCSALAEDPPSDGLNVIFTASRNALGLAGVLRWPLKEEFTATRAHKRLDQNQRLLFAVQLCELQTVCSPVQTSLGCASDENAQSLLHKTLFLSPSTAGVSPPSPPNAPVM